MSNIKSYEQFVNENLFGQYSYYGAGSLFPIVQKLGKDGYDGKGVQILKNLEDAKQNGFDAPSLLEEKVDIEKEISVIVARNEKGEIAVFDAVEMVVNEKYNLLDYLLAPANITESQKITKEKHSMLMVYLWNV